MISEGRSATPAPAAVRRVLMISPHFPPDSSAGTHRVRLLAPHLQKFGWIPTVLTVDPAYYEGKPDPELAELVPPGLRVERSRAIAPRISRFFGIGDLGLRSFGGLYGMAVSLLARERHDALFITIYPSYTALLGPLLKRRFGIPFVLDYQDPWVGSWGKTVGAGKAGSVDIKSRLSRLLGTALEPYAVRAADAITAVSSGTIDGVTSRIPEARKAVTATIPIGGEESDFERATGGPRNQFFDPSDGLFHVCYVGTLLPLGFETLRAVLAAVASLRETRPDVFSRLRLHFIGTSNERKPGSPARVRDIARQLGLAESVTEHPMRVDYAEAIRVQVQASALLLMGSTEHHYTASKLYPALLARRPVIAVYHRLSSVSTILAGHSAEHIRLVEFGDADPPEAHSERIAAELASMVDRGPANIDPALSSMDAVYSARHLAGVLAGVFDQVSMAPSVERA